MDEKKIEFIKNKLVVKLMTTSGNILFPLKNLLEMPSKTEDGKNIYTFICFEFPNDECYYSKKYVKKCMMSWSKKFGYIRIILIPIIQCINISEWTKKTYVRRCYPTDSLRMLFISMFDNCIYVDTDCFISEEFDESVFDKYDCFIANNCPGTMTWNKHKNNKKFIEYFDHYEELAKNIKDPMEKYVNDNGDCTVFGDFGKNLITPVNITGVDHFSLTWSLMWANKNKKFYLSTSNENCKFNFSKDAMGAWIDYCFDRDYSDYIIPTDIDCELIGFV